jgi:tRNA(His) guanylyltransferase
VIDYFRWCNEDAHRNAWNSHCYWSLRKEGVTANEATERLTGLSVAEKNELLFQKGINFNELPNRQKRGIGISWEAYEKEATNPKTGESVLATRNRLKVDYDLPMKDDYSNFINQLVPEIV